MLRVLKDIFSSSAPQLPPSALPMTTDQAAEMAAEMVGEMPDIFKGDAEVEAWWAERMQTLTYRLRDINPDTCAPADLFTIAEVLADLSRHHEARRYLDMAMDKAEALGTTTTMSFTFFLTELCNLRCNHCFIYDEFAEPFLRRSDELSTADVIKTIEGLNIPGTGRSIYFAGGEIFARRDLEEIFEATAKLGIDFAVGTNGTFPDKLDKLLANDVIRPHIINVQFSIDGIRESHEAIRGKNTYDPLLRSIDVVKKYGLPINAVTVIQPENRDHVDEIKKTFADLGILHHRFQLESKGRFPGTPDWQQFRHLLPTREYVMGELTPIVPGEGCEAGVRTATIRPNGVVEACRLSAVGNISHLILGDLKDYEFDMDALLTSDNARDVIRITQNCEGCALYCAR